MPDDDNDDRKVKELLEADLARWFSLPSAADQPPAEEEQQTAPVDEEMQQVIERRRTACAAVDPAFVRAIHERTDENPRVMLTFKAELEVQPYNLGIVDEHLVAKIAGDPRMYDLPEDLRDDMRDCTPQALLRDLHRPVLEFYRESQPVDMAAVIPIDVVEAVASAMTTRYRPQRLVSPLGEERRFLAEIFERRRKSWLEGLSTLPNRRIQE